MGFVWFSCHNNCLPTTEIKSSNPHAINLLVDRAWEEIIDSFHVRTHNGLSAANFRPCNMSIQTKGLCEPNHTVLRPLVF